ncbi:MAG: hypothetical protein GX813_02625, partial [Erysipelotrichia bacterium]|nr:hypothetical protein [Erysipelotrichia bacterium]
LEGVVVFSQFSLTKTQQLFLKTVFKEIKVESLKDYVHNCENVVKEVIKSYGAVNEIAAVINKIASENLNLGQCQIVLIKPDYLYHLINKVDYLSLVNEKKVAITYRQGFPLSLTTPGQMLLAIKNLAAKLYGIDEYDYFFESAFFNKKLINPTMNDRWWAAFKKYVGWLRLSFEDANEVTAIYEENGMFEALQIFNADLKKGIPFFIKKYCLITEETRDQAALSVIESSFTSLQKYGLNQAKIINILLRKNVNQTLSAPNALHVTTLDYAFESNRPYTFIVGLSGDYPGQPTENCLIFDDEFLKIDDSGHFTSTQIIKRKDQLLVDFIQGSGQTYLTYPYYRFVDQKDVNPTSYITNYKGLVTEFTFKDDYLSRLHNLISDYQNNCLIENILPLVKRPNYDFKRLLDKKYSPSRLATYFFGHKLVFVFNELFGLNLGDENDPFEVIPANEKGVLIHAALEGYQEGDDQKEVRSKALSLFRNFIKQKPSDLKSSVADIEADFM